MRPMILSGLLVLFASAALVADPLPSTRVEELIARLADRDFKVRGRAARDLGNLGLAARAAVPALSRCLRDPMTEVRDRAGKALAQIGVPAVPELIRALSDRDAGIRNRAARTLAVIGPEAKAAVPALLAALKDRQPEIRMASIVALGEMGPEGKEAAPRLVHFLQERNARTRELAGLALRQIGPAALGPLQKMLVEDKRAARLESMRALRLFGAEAKSAVPALRQAMKDPDPRLRAVAAETLGQIGFEARDEVPELLDALRDKSREAHNRAAEALVALTLAGVPGMLEKVRAAENKQVWVRHRGGQDRKAPKDPLTPWLKDLLHKDPKVRARAVLALGSSGPAAEARVIAPLKRMLEDEDEEVRLSAAMALARVQRNKTEMLLAVRRTTSLLERMHKEIGTLDRATQAKLFEMVDLYIILKLTTRGGLQIARAEQQFQQLGPEAIPALVHGMNTVANLGLGDC